jgi:hypothetical protein
MGVDRTQNALRQGDVDSCGLVAELAGIDINDSPRSCATKAGRSSRTQIIFVLLSL